jgi:hypothetical protein
MRRARRLLLGALAVALAVPALSVAAIVPAGAAEPERVAPFVGLGTWIDVYDYVPGFRADGSPPPIDVDSVDTMAALGVETLYLQASQDDERLAGDTVDPELLGAFLERAHELDVRVVAWYLPKFDDLDADLRRIRALHRFRSGGERFDGLALDVEWTGDVPDVAARNAALVKLARRTRKAVGEDTPLGAIVLEPLLLEEVNPRYWPDFPWRKIRGSFDVWLPMSYWTNREEESGLRDGFRYTRENVQRLRTRLGDADAVVHPIGGIADQAAAADYEGFVRGARQVGAVGWSVYDFDTTTSGAWAILRGG